MGTSKIIGSPDFVAIRVARLPARRVSPRTPQAAIPPAPAAAARDTSGAAGRKPESVRRNSRRLAGSTRYIVSVCTHLFRLGKSLTEVRWSKRLSNGSKNPKHEILATILVIAGTGAMLLVWHEAPCSLAALA